MIILLYLISFIVPIAFLLWANYKLEITREKREAIEVDPNLQAVAEHCWKTGKTVTGSVGDDGHLTITEHEPID